MRFKKNSPGGQVNNNRECPYCSKVFRYPSILKRHLKLKNMCGKQENARVSLTSDPINQTSDPANQTSDRVSLASDLVSQIKNSREALCTVPIRLSLA